ncbi:AAA family ATPase [Nocardia fluminea]|uniref:helix-turn-helix transcriptional regulator n=1 Tax=Nocardia fluminea TaxID=134984 RepID=UPI003649A8B5
MDEQQLIGRASDLDWIADRLAETADGHGGAVVLYGEPGVGKSALADAAAASAHGFRVIRCAGSVSESQLAFSALHALLWQLRDRIDALPAPQSNALAAALGLRDTTADRFLVAAATVTLLSDLGSEEPVLVIIDDADLIDPCSAECLTFVGRRLGWDRVFLLATAPPAQPTPWSELPHRKVENLHRNQAEALLCARRPTLDHSARHTILDVADGNPLALLYLPAVETVLATAGPIPLDERLRAAFGAVVAALSEPVRAQLLVVAAQDGAEISAVAAVAARLGAGEWALDPEVDTGILILARGRVGFAHRLVLAAVYANATAGQRFAVHRAWSQELSDPADADQRAWHLAAAAQGTDDSVADLLEQTATRAWQRGGPAAAAAALRSAAALTRDLGAGGRRLALAARAEWEAGHLRSARELLLGAADRVGADAAAVSGGLEGMIEFAHGDCVRAAALLGRDARRAADSDPGRMLAVLALRAQWSAGRLDLDDEQAVVAVFATSGPGLTSWLAVVGESWRTGQVCEVPQARAAAATRDGFSEAWLLPPAPYAAVWGLGGRVYAQYRAAVDHCRADGMAAALAFTLSQMATVDILAGRWTQALAAAEEARELAVLTGIDSVTAQCHNSLAWLAALRGDVEATMRLTETSIRIGQTSNAQALSAGAHWHRGVALLLTGQAEQALTMLSPIGHPGSAVYHPTFALLAAPDTAEAAIRVGDREEAMAQISLLNQWEQRSGAGWAAAAHRRSLALLTDGASSERLFRQALECAPRGLDRPIHRARTELLFGEWLRRKRRRNDSRAHFSYAREVFANLGAEPLLRRAEEGLDIASRAPRPRETTTFDDLTAQELRVARLAAVGGTNRDIAAQLFISPRTVGHHLSSVYLKLGINSRKELADADLPD